MTAHDKTHAVIRNLVSRGISISFEDANTLRRAQLTLRRWAEHCCNGDICRDEETGKPWWFNTNARYLDPQDPRAYRVIPDREAGALRRVAEICQRNGLHYYHQTDPRGCALYVSRKPLTQYNYTDGAHCCA